MLSDPKALGIEREALISRIKTSDLVLIECDIVTVFVIFCPRLLHYGVVE